MKTLLKGLGWMLTWGASAAYAAQGNEGETLGWLGYMFIGFFTVVITTQLIPVVILFGGILKGILTTGAGGDTANHYE
jgi:hypothetical protein